jgi:hypothetical protein
LQIKRDKISFKKRSKIPAEFRRELITPLYDEQNTRDKEKFQELFLNCPVKVIEKSSPSRCSYLLRIILSGVIQNFHSKTDRNSKLRVIRFRHNKERPYTYSYAVLLGDIWWLFYEFCIDDGLYSSIGGISAKILVENELENMKEYIDLKTYNIDDEMKFFHFLESKTLSYLREMLHINQDFNANLRGDLLELLIYYYFTKKKCKTWLNRKYSTISRQDIDIVAIHQNNKKCDLYLVECEEASFKEEYSINESKIKKFEKKVEKIKEKPSMLLEELEVDSLSHIKLHPIYVTTGYIEEKPDNVLGEIEYWDFSRIQKELRKIEDSKRFLRTLEKFYEVPSEISDLDILNMEYFD